MGRPGPPGAPRRACGSLRRGGPGRGSRRAAVTTAVSVKRPSDKRLGALLAGRRLDDRLRPLDLLLRGQAGALDDRQLTRVNGGAARKARGTGAGGAESVQVADVGTDGLGGRGQARRPRGDDHAGAGPVEARVLRHAQAGPQVLLAGRDAAQGRMGGGHVVRTLDAEGRLQRRVQGEPAAVGGHGPPRHPHDVGGGGHLGQPQAGRGDGRQVGPAPGAGRGVDADVDRDRLRVAQQLGGGGTGVRLAVGGDRVLQADHHYVGPAAERLRHPTRPVARRVQPRPSSAPRARSRCPGQSPGTGAEVMRAVDALHGSPLRGAPRGAEPCAEPSPV